jgi:hypothetical protein
MSDAPVIAFAITEDSAQCPSGWGQKDVADAGRQSTSAPIVLWQGHFHGASLNASYQGWQQKHTRREHVSCRLRADTLS